MAKEVKIQFNPTGYTHNVYTGLTSGSTNTLICSGETVQCVFTYDNSFVTGVTDNVWVRITCDGCKDQFINVSLLRDECFDCFFDGYAIVLYVTPTPTPSNTPTPTIGLTPTPTPSSVNQCIDIQRTQVITDPLNCDLDFIHRQYTLTYKLNGVSSPAPQNYVLTVQTSGGFFNITLLSGQTTISGLILLQEWDNCVERNRTNYTIINETISPFINTCVAPSPTPTPTPTVTPTITPSSTPTTLPCECYDGQVTTSGVYYYTDCEGNLIYGGVMTSDLGLNVCLDRNKPFAGVSLLTPSTTCNCPGDILSCINLNTELIAPNPQTGFFNYFGAKVTLSNAPIDENITITGYLQDTGNLSNTVNFNILIPAGMDSGQTSDSEIQTAPADTAQIFITNVTPTQVTFSGNTYPICGYENVTAEIEIIPEIGGNPDEINLRVNVLTGTTLDNLNFSLSIIYEFNDTMCSGLNGAISQVGSITLTSGSPTTTGYIGMKTVGTQGAYVNQIKVNGQNIITNPQEITIGTNTYRIVGLNQCTIL